MDCVAAYDGIRQRVAELARAPEAADTFVPATPDWTVKDVVAHVTGILADVLSGTIDNVGTDEWTAKHVSDRRDQEVDTILAEWDGHWETIRPLAGAAPLAQQAALVADAVTHEHDIRGALGRPGARESDAVDIALDAYVRRLGQRLGEAGLGLAVRTAGREWLVGETGAQASVAAEPFELLRALTGRRSAEQIEGLDWDGDPSPFVPLFSTYPLRDTPLEE